MRKCLVCWALNLSVLASASLLVIGCGGHTNKKRDCESIILSPLLVEKGSVLSRGATVRRSVCLDHSKFTFDECVEKGRVFGDLTTFQEESVRAACRKHFSEIYVLTPHQLASQESYSEKGALIVFGIPLGEVFSNDKVEKVLKESKSLSGRILYAVVPNNDNQYFIKYSVGVYDNLITAVRALSRCDASSILECQDGFVSIEKYLNDKYGKPKTISKDKNEMIYKFGESEQGLPYRYRIVLARGKTLPGESGDAERIITLMYTDEDSIHKYKVNHR